MSVLPPKRILLVVDDCQSGDALRITPYVRAVRAQYATAHITLLVDAGALPVFERWKDFDRIVVSRLYARGGSSSFRTRVTKGLELARVVGVLGLRYDLVVTFLWGTTLLHALGVIVGRNQRIGFARRFPRLLTSNLGELNWRGDHVRPHADLLRAAGVTLPGPIKPLMEFGDDDLEVVTRPLVARGVSTARPLVVLHPGSDWACQQWLPERWAALADALVATYDAQVVFTGIAQEQALVTAIQSHMHAASVSLAGHTTLAQLAALLARARLCVCVDSAVFEVAQAAGVPSVVLAGPTRPQNVDGNARRPIVLNVMTPSLRQDINECRDRHDARRGCLDYHCPMAGLRELSVEDVLARIEQSGMLPKGASVASATISNVTSPSQGATTMSESISIPRAHTTDAGRIPAATSPSVTVVIPTRNRGALIEETLEALTHLQERDEEFEILVVDQSTHEATQQVVRRFMAPGARVRYHVSATVGSSANRNLGALLSTTDIVAYVDDDCIVDGNYIEALRAAFSNRDVSAVYGRLEPYERRGRTGRDVGLKDSHQRCEYVGRVPPWYIGHGGNMAFRRADLLEVGGFDPLLSAGGLLRSNEDGDISYRLLVAGKRIAYEPDVLAYHKHWKDWRAQAAMERAYGIGAGGQFAKYIRCRDYYGLRLLGVWLWQLGVRRVGAGLLKWRSLKTMYLGYCQLVYPWIGLWRSLRYQVDPQHVCYRDPVHGEGMGEGVHSVIG